MTQRGDSEIGFVLWIAIFFGMLTLCDIERETKKTNEHLKNIEAAVKEHATTCPAPPEPTATRTPDPNR